MHTGIREQPGGVFLEALSTLQLSESPTEEDARSNTPPFSSLCNWRFGGGFWEDCPADTQKGWVFGISYLNWRASARAIGQSPLDLACCLAGCKSENQIQSVWTNRRRLQACWLSEGKGPCFRWTCGTLTWVMLCVSGKGFAIWGTKYQAGSAFLSFLPFFFWLIRACANDINSEQNRKLKIAAATTFPLHLALLLWDLKNAKL